MKIYFKMSLVEFITEDLMSIIRVKLHISVRNNIFKHNLRDSNFPNKE